MEYFQGIRIQDYQSQKNTWPKTGKSISGHFNSSCILLYQAFSSEIARPALIHGNFLTDNPGFSPTRMTWIKPNFLWMMFRSDWGRSKNQENILAFWVDLEWFRSVLKQAKLSGKDKNCRGSDVVVQWDPDHGPSGVKNSLRRDIQIGIRGKKAIEWAQGTAGPAVKEIINFNPLVEQARRVKDHGNFFMPVEEVFEFYSENIDLVEVGIDERKEDNE
jgi:hypothetical protein